MKRLSSLILTCALVATACSQAPKSDEPSPEDGWRKLGYVIEIDTPEGLKVGRSVVAERTTCEKNFPQGSICDAEVQGEAAIVDLPDGTTLYAALTGNGFGDHPVAPRNAWEIDEEGNATEQYKRDSLPDLLMFTQPSVPSSLIQIDPEKPFGDGYTVKRAYVERDLDPNTPVTRRIMDKLPWLSDWSGNFLNGSKLTRRSGPVPEQYGTGSLLMTGQY